MGSGGCAKHAPYILPTKIERNGADISTDCTWLDRDHARDGTEELENIEAAAMQIHMQVTLPFPFPSPSSTPQPTHCPNHSPSIAQDFTNLTDTHPADPSYYCNPPALLFVRDYDYEFRLEWWEHAIPSRSRIAFWKDHGFKANRQLSPAPYHHRHRPRPRHRHQRQRQPSKRSPALRSKLVSSAHEKHSARALCESETSHGPDFLSRSEGLFCDMGSKRVWPVCGTGEVEVGCYDLGNHSLVAKGEEEGRGYAHVEEWV